MGSSQNHLLSLCLKFFPFYRNGGQFKEHDRKKLEVQTQRVVNWLGGIHKYPEEHGG